MIDEESREIEKAGHPRNNGDHVECLDPQIEWQQ
jgi:hypothetical protein